MEPEIQTQPTVRMFAQPLSVCQLFILQIETNFSLYLIFRRLQFWKTGFSSLFSQIINFLLLLLQPEHLKNMPVENAITKCATRAISREKYKCR